MSAEKRDAEAARDAALARVTELEQRLARVAELAHDRDGDTLEYRSQRLGKCADVSWDHMEESFSKDPLKRRATLKWAHLAAQLTLAEEKLAKLGATDGSEALLFHGSWTDLATEVGGLMAKRGASDDDVAAFYARLSRVFLTKGRKR